MGGISLVFVCGNQWGPPQTRLRNLKMEVLVIRPFGVFFWGGGRMKRVFYFFQAGLFRGRVHYVTDVHLHLRLRPRLFSGRQRDHAPFLPSICLMEFDGTWWNPLMF